jgi:hypothetical protein
MQSLVPSFGVEVRIVAMPVQHGRLQSRQPVVQQSSAGGASAAADWAKDTGTSFWVWQGASPGWTEISHIGRTGTGQAISAIAIKRRS